jgi:hypothetical protein
MSLKGTWRSYTVGLNFGHKKTPWSESASELYRLSNRRLSMKWLPIFADKGCHLVSVTDPYGRIQFSRQEPLLFYQVAPQLYSRGWVDPVISDITHVKNWVSADSSGKEKISEMFEEDSLWGMQYSRMWCRVGHVRTEVSEKIVASIFREEKSTNEENC